MSTTHKHYEVRIKGEDSYFSSQGYSKYNERFRFRLENDYPENFEIYGLEQAKEHIEELKESVYEGVKHLKNKEFEIIEVTTIRKIVSSVGTSLENGNLSLENEQLAN